jgi:hypothetical protein
MPLKMKDVKVHVDLSGLNETVQHINLRSEEPLMTMKKYILGRIDRNFERQGALFGQPWQELALSTRIYKRRLGLKADVPLVRTGRMISSFRGDIIKRQKGWFRLIISNQVPYFIKHQSAKWSERMITPFRMAPGRRRRRPLPRRIMMRIMQADRYHLRRIYEAWVKSTIQKFNRKTVASR